ncbi:VOC family protein [Chitinophaga sp. GbtcB8]|uniref:bleomycin resistance protein n=1 Tax=Chitinophaga sp. GbtcB8 TaxID=2824753 RepID=UPI001C305432|nr:VOC family protein [Chitinophaga sp. GbtcB8]
MNIITPIFPCRSLDELIDFYRVLGFEVTYHQKSPNPYAILEKGWLRLDFYGTKQHVPNQCYHTCYILTDEADELYEVFTSALRSHYGKLPTRGLPRISEIRDKKYGVREFMFSDVAGNCIRIGRKIAIQEEEIYSKEVEAASKRLSLALDFAYKSEDEEGELEKVSAVLDKAIEKDKGNHCRNLYKVMILRADLAIAQGDQAKAVLLLEQVRKSPDIERQPDKFSTELQRVADLEQKIDPHLLTP